MSSETIVTAIFLIASVVAAGILTSQLFPAIYTVSGSVSSSAHTADQSLRTDFVIVNTFSLQGTSKAEIWIKNTGTSRISQQDLVTSNIFIGSTQSFDVLSSTNFVAAPPAAGQWTFDILDDTNGYWEPGETLHVTIQDAKISPTYADIVYFQIVLHDGTKRSEEFTVS
ncbi:MAG TPA: flagellin [Methanomicrobiales archaeon]|nr:flagellin [Methanomicrobiales archaeon]